MSSRQKRRPARKAGGKSRPKKQGNRVIRSTAPVAIATTRTVTSTRSPHVEKHTEYIGDVSSTTANVFAIDLSQAINPGNSTLFPWLSQIAPSFEEVEWLEVEFQFDPSAPTNTPGKVHMGVVYDTYDPDFSTKSEMNQYQGMKDGSVWKPLSARVDMKIAKQRQRNLYVLPDGATPAGDYRLYDLGRFFFAHSGCPANTLLGEVWVKFTVQLKKPKRSTTGVVRMGEAWTSVFGGPTIPPSSQGATLSVLTESADLLNTGVGELSAEDVQSGYGNLGGTGGNVNGFYPNGLSPDGNPIKRSWGGGKSADDHWLLSFLTSVIASGTGSATFQAGLLSATNLVVGATDYDSAGFGPSSTFDLHGHMLLKSTGLVNPGGDTQVIPGVITGPTTGGVLNCIINAGSVLVERVSKALYDSVVPPARSREEKKLHAFGLNHPTIGVHLKKHRIILGSLLERARRSTRIAPNYASSDAQKQSTMSDPSVAPLRLVRQPASSNEAIQAAQRCASVPALVLPEKKSETPAPPPTPKQGVVGQLVDLLDEKNGIDLSREPPETLRDHEIAISVLRASYAEIAGEQARRDVLRKEGVELVLTEKDRSDVQLEVQRKFLADELQVAREEMREFRRRAGLKA